ncbi:hypothetical protein HK096_006334, partial [Nowakowskiella sp. JEL0078]
MKRIYKHEHKGRFEFLGQLVSQVNEASANLSSSTTVIGTKFPFYFLKNILTLANIEVSKNHVTEFSVSRAIAASVKADESALESKISALSSLANFAYEPSNYESLWTLD